LPVHLLLLIAVHAYSQDSLIFRGSFGNFQNAASISSAREEFIFVSDISTNKIHKLDVNGAELASFGGPGLGENELNLPLSIDASNGLDVFVADYQNNRIKRLDLKLNFILSFDFNSYNRTSESSNKIYNPYGVVTISTGELFVLCDAVNFKAAKLSSYSEVSLLFGSSNLGADKLDKPSKIVKGNQLDIWILDKARGDILNFNNIGVFIRKISPKYEGEIISVAFFNENLFILHAFGLIVYDLTKGQYSKFYRFPYFKDITDITVFDKNTVLFLSKDSVHKYSIPQN
jgi:hypothetical protein